jgi:hypothetical protein
LPFEKNNIGDKQTHKQTNKQTNKLNASRDRGQYDCYITAIEIGNKIGNNEEI